MLRFMILTLVVGCSLLAGCGDDAMGPADPLELWYSQSNDTVIFMSRAHSPEGEIYQLNKSGDITRLTYNAMHENNLALSGDGSMVAYQAGDEGNMTGWEIYVMEISSGIETRLTFNSVIDAHPDWGPGDSLLVFSSWQDSLGLPTGAADIFTMRTDGSEVTRLTDSPWEDNDAEWSPDGSQIAFKSNRRTGISAREEIFVMSADGSDVTGLTFTSGWESDHDPSWSPDGTKIVYNHYEGSRPWTDMMDPSILAEYWEDFIPWNACAVDLQGNSRQLTNEEYAMALPVFSATGDAVLFLRMDFIVDTSDILIGMYHRLILVPESGGSGQQLIPDDEHTGTMECFDW